MRVVKYSLGVAGIAAVVLLSVNAVNTINREGDVYKKTKTVVDSTSKVQDYNVYALKVPAEMNFAGEKVPLADPDVHERMDRELLVNTYWQSNGLLLLKRANKYFPIIEPILKKNGVPDDFKYLAVAESALEQVVSPAGATGFWQFMERTAEQYGLEVNDNIDERYHIEKATQAACEYLKNAKARLGSWTLAAAAYNAGMRGIERELERQKATNYYDLLLWPETGRYVFRILALKEIMSQPKAYGFNFEESDLYHLIPTKKVKIDTSVADFPRFAHRFSINYKILKIHNPWLREAQLENDEGYTYYIKIPKDGYYPIKPK